MGLYARGDKFGVVEANHLLTGGIGRVSAGGANEIRVFYESGDYVLKIYDNSISDWKIVEKTRSIGRNYHGAEVMDENNPILIPFYVDASHTSVKLKLWGQNFPSFHYTELPAHDHGGATFPTPTHVHAGPSHNHGFSGYTGYSGGHNHGGDTGSTAAGTYLMAGHVHSISNVSDHRHSLSGDTENSGAQNTGAPSATAAIPSAGISGGALNDTQKVNVDDLIEVYVTAVQGTWGTAKTKLTAGWETLANINTNGGTNEIDLFSYVTPGSFMYIRIVEPTTKKGGKVLWHISLS